MGAFQRQFQAAGAEGLARNGQGIVPLPRIIISDDLRAGRLKIVLPNWDAPELWLTPYYPPPDRIPARLTLFSDFVEQAIRSMPIFDPAGVTRPSHHANVIGHSAPSG
ncbi:LysR substrate-binding domain-containing protein [Paracoccus laeviglucosivorans]|uniref:LysR substrate-binding domain-containing protein n=1 Tax=Paracoccus laeviglucosivorans TaxID=1197861 RepID=UPI001157F7EB|nr:LysR substrate-binding domain-containing protein [Paracoccus laeviglucosivorans]